MDRLFVAFSREGKQKDYVQHHIAREAALVAPLLREGPESQGIFYICGDAKNMAKVCTIWQCFAEVSLILDPRELMQDFQIVLPNVGALASRLCLCGRW